MNAADIVGYSGLTLVAGGLAWGWLPRRNRRTQAGATAMVLGLLLLVMAGGLA